MAAFVALGSNLGDRRAILERALRELTALGAGILGQSGLYETEPIGITSRQPFLNAVVELSWGGSPGALLEALHGVEQTLGRRRDHPDGDRTCDLDLLLFHDRVIDTPTLTEPHPGMTGRRFVLEPLLELAPELVDPATGSSYADALPATADQPCRLFVSSPSWANE